MPREDVLTRAKAAIASAAETEVISQGMVPELVAEIERLLAANAVLVEACEVAEAAMGGMNAALYMREAITKAAA